MPNATTCTLGPVLDLLADGVLVADSTGTIIFRNAAAVRQIGHVDTLAQVAALAIASSKRTLRDRFACPSHQVDGSRVTLCLAAAGKEYVARRVRLGSDRPCGHGQAHVAVFVSEIRAARWPSTTLLVDRYAATPAEAQVCVLVVGGLAPREVADALDISLTTTRTHLSRVFAKTGTKNQADLVRFGLTLASPVQTTD